MLGILLTKRGKTKTVQILMVASMLLIGLGLALL